MDQVVSWLPHVNASLNLLATVLLLAGFVVIKSAPMDGEQRRRREILHRNIMLTCFGVSAVFLVCYLFYHFNIPGGSKKFPPYPPAVVKYLYYAILLTHVVLAAAVPVLALGTIYFGLTGQRQRHRAWARWTFPIWLYVSITGVVVYALLYQIFPPS